MVKKLDKDIVYWLASGCLLVMIMVVVGGITRLTHSGLSMVQWNLFMGSIPPLNETQWLEVFELYKKTPEYKLVNYDFTLKEFKSIFWWEYIHRMIGRLTGLVFIIPLVYFLIKRRLSKPFLKKLLILFGLGAFQGFMGWYMVKSGLVKNPNVSHYRLASHLVIAFALYGFTFWLMLETIFHDHKSGPLSTHKTLINITKGLLIILAIQIIYGAFVSGLKAGAIYNTFPKMGKVWIAKSVSFAFQKNGFISFFENHASVQFIHRYVAYVVVFLVYMLWRISRNLHFTKAQVNGLNIVMGITICQFLLGVFTLIYAVPVSLGVLHQLGALILFTAIINFLFHLLRTK